MKDLHIVYALTILFACAAGFKTNAACCLTPTTALNNPLPIGSKFPQAIAFSPDSLYVAVANQNSKTITLFKTHSCGALDSGVSSSFSAFYPRSLAFSPVLPTPPGQDARTLSEQWLAAADFTSNSLKLFTVVNGALQEEFSRALPTPSYGPCSAAFSPNGSLIVTANSTTNDVTIFKLSKFTIGSFPTYTLSKGKSQPLPNVSLEPASVAFSPDGLYVATANRGSSDVTLFPVIGDTLGQGSSRKVPSPSGAPCSLAFSPNGLLLAVANNTSNNVTLFKIKKGAIEEQGVSYLLPKDCEYPVSLAFSPNGLCLVTSNFLTHNIAIFTVTGGALSGGRSYSLPTESLSPVSVAYSPDGLLIATANRDSSNVSVFS